MEDRRWPLEIGAHIPASSRRRGARVGDDLFRCNILTEEAGQDVGRWLMVVKIL